MERQYITYLLIGLLGLLCVSVVAYFVLASRTDARERKQRRDHQVQRERLAVKRIADNGGLPLSSGAAARSAASQNPRTDPTSGTGQE